MACTDRLEEGRNLSPEFLKPPFETRIPLPRKNLTARNDPHHNSQYIPPRRPTKHPVATSYQLSQDLQTRRSPRRQRVKDFLVRGRGEHGGPVLRVARGVNEEILRLDHE